MNSADFECDVVICGAGPVGLTAALKLARHGVSCHILEKRKSLNVASKASTFHPPTLEILDEFGLIDTMLQQGVKADRIAYLRDSGEVFACFDQPTSLHKDTTIPFRVHLEQSAVTPHLLSKAIETGLVKINFEADVVDVGQDESTAWAKTNRGLNFRGRFLLGADGGQSSVRKSVGISQTGSKYPGRVLRLMVGKSIKKRMPELAPVTYIYSSAGESISLLEMPDCWRIIIRVAEGLSEDEVKSPNWYLPIVQRFLPKIANKETSKLEVHGTDVYGASKMLATSNRVGRIGLIGDAVHLTNTKGGMNMNCGFHDAYAVAGVIIKQLQVAPDCTDHFDSVMDERFKVARDVLLPRTDKNVSGKEDWLAFIADAAADPAKSRNYLLTSSMLDMAPNRL